MRGRPARRAALLGIAAVAGCGGDGADRGDRDAVVDIVDAACVRAARIGQTDFRTSTPTQAIVPRLVPLVARTADSLRAAPASEDRTALLDIAGRLERDLRALYAAPRSAPGSGTRALDDTERDLRDWRSLAGARLGAGHCRPDAAAAAERLAEGAYEALVSFQLRRANRALADLRPRTMRAIELERFDFRRAVVPRDVRGRHRAYVAALARFDRAGRRIIRDGGRLRGHLGAAFAPVAQTSRRLVGALDYDD